MGKPPIRSSGISLDLGTFGDYLRSGTSAIANSFEKRLG
ncbi:hypothetical protein M595_6032 [Lyngbya aestuarii BL J]|uniref:Uncharacterized protein n=1 Tax=Lyngbya aestuarii BL J TaxID=1348334 RepID=U7Q898_9CYAN|nr:hypothetical protein M595_6032 [Lyngbya aestuarii BL J]